MKIFFFHFLKADNDKKSQGIYLRPPSPFFHEETAPGILGLICEIESCRQFLTIVESGSSTIKVSRTY